MSKQGWQETLIVAQTDGAALTASTTPTSLLPPAARYTLPSNYFSEPGKSLRINARGRVSTVTTPGTLTLDLRFGTTATPIVVFNGGAMTLNATAQTNATWEFEAVLTCRSIGSGVAATMMGVGSFSSRALVGSPAAGAGYAGGALLPDTAPAVGTGFDSTVTNVIDFFGTWGTNNANSIQVHEFVVESLN
jgi:hypothetical protein